MIVIQRLIRDRVLQITALLVVISLFIGRPKASDISFATLWSNSCHDDGDSNLRTPTYS